MQKIKVHKAMYIQYIACRTVLKHAKIATQLIMTCSN